ncbi:MAG: hypothetical protein A2X86_02315 [Bdellovibrionales bacterium GWA2_49_15]|nr:MAG: hypothetical protein A2X86_02315 [Bdellovibrionales bacterium GWA2_49_15]
MKNIFKNNKSRLRGISFAIACAQGISEKLRVHFIDLKSSAKHNTEDWRVGPSIGYIFSFRGNDFARNSFLNSTIGRKGDDLLSEPDPRRKYKKMIKR